jgi:hypothetical protein
MTVLAHNSDDRARETHRQPDFAQLYDLKVRLLEEVQTNSRNMPLAVQQSTEPLTLQVDLTQVLCVRAGLSSSYSRSRS